MSAASQRPHTALFCLSLNQLLFLVLSTHLSSSVMFQYLGCSAV